ncbi:MAG: methionine--tRNA ligase [Gemmataceae bacterium]|nr:methionine--tRNA ligase [Gemmataceae bacterium]
MADAPRFYLTTAIDYPNSRPHIGTAFEKIGADVQARYRRMEGYDVHFLMGNDENTVKVAKRAAELGQDVKAYCDDMARQFQEVWRALDISHDEFVQTSEPRHHRCARQFIQKVYDAGYIYKGGYEGWYCDGCEAFKTDTEAKLNNGLCDIHKAPLTRRTEPCYSFALTKFQDRLAKYLEEHPDFIQPESRRNEILSLMQTGLQDVNITRQGQSWGIKVPFDEDFTIWVWFDALLTYFTGIGYATDDDKFKKWWPANIHFIGKDITRFHCAIWPAMLMAAGLEPPRMVFGHGFVYRKNEETGKQEKYSKTLGNIVDPMEIIPLFGADAFRYYFLRECPFPGDGEFSKERYGDVFNSDLANNLGNLYSRCVTVVSKNYESHLPDTAKREPGVINTDVEIRTTVQQVQKHIEACQYNQALEKIWRQLLDPANRYTDKKEPWKQVKTDKEAAKHTLYDMVEQLRAAAILLKPFLPKTAETIYRSFNFPQPWEQVRYEDVWVHPPQVDDLRVTAALEDGKVKPLFPRIS